MRKIALIDIPDNGGVPRILQLRPMTLIDRWRFRKAESSETCRQLLDSGLSIYAEPEVLSDLYVIGPPVAQKLDILTGGAAPEDTEVLLV